MGVDCISNNLIGGHPERVGVGRKHAETTITYKFRLGATIPRALQISSSWLANTDAYLVS